MTKERKPNLGKTVYAPLVTKRMPKARTSNLSDSNRMDMIWTWESKGQERSKSPPLTRDECIREDGKKGQHNHMYYENLSMMSTPANGEDLVVG